MFFIAVFYEMLFRDGFKDFFNNKRIFVIETKHYLASNWSFYKNIVTKICKTDFKV